jgi:hypothetical protein
MFVGEFNIFIFGSFGLSAPTASRMTSETRIYVVPTLKLIWRGALLRRAA